MKNTSRKQYKINKKKEVVKRNILNEIRKTPMSINMARFFNIYLSKINKDDPSTRKITFGLKDFINVLNINCTELKQLRAATKEILTIVLDVNNINAENGRFEGFAQVQLFSECNVGKDEKGEWVISIEAHPKALPYMFEFKNKYVHYPLWCVLQLRSANQIRLYEILKQAENISPREYDVDELQDLLGIDANKYERFANFKARVLDPCQKAINENTDIYITYRKGKTKPGRGGGWQSIIFDITKNPNDNYDKKELTKTGDITQKELDKIFDKYNRTITDDSDIPSDTFIDKLISTTQNQFTLDELKILQDLLKKIVGDDENKCAEYLSEKMNVLAHYEFKKTSNGDKINDRFAYLRKILLNDLKEKNNPANKSWQDHSSFDIDEIAQLGILSDNDMPQFPLSDSSEQEQNTDKNNTAYKQQQLRNLHDACQQDFSQDQINILYDLLEQLPAEQYKAKVDYLRGKYLMLLATTRADNLDNDKKFEILKNTIENDVNT